jgi:oxygen-dependent protoporphyrinogen oxidase
MKKVSVIGAGFAGLTLSLRLAQKGFTVELFEKEPRVGGLLGTDRTDYGISEKAANALIRTKESEDLFKELGIQPSYPLESSKKRFIFRDHPTRWPLKFTETLQFIFKFIPKFIFAKNKLRPKEFETLESWGQRHLGSAATDYILGPAMQGIYANEISGLSSKLILGGLFSRKKNKRYSGLLTGPGGMQDLIDQLESRLRQLGVQIHTSTTVELKDLEGPVVLATSATAAAALLESSIEKSIENSLANTTAQTSKILKTIKMSSLISVTLFFKNEQKKYQGFGCLIPRKFHFKTLGILMNSYIFKDRNGTYNETWILGGVQEQSLLALSDLEIISLIQTERKKILNLDSEIHDHRINRWDHALPYYDLTLEKAQQDLNQLIPNKKTYLHGNYLSGIGLSKILERSEFLSEEIAKHHG